MKSSRMIAIAFGVVAGLSCATVVASKEALKPRKLGVIVMSLQSESLGRWAANVQTAAAKLNWQVVVKNGENNPAVVSTLLPELVTGGVDAVITMAVDAPLMSEGLKTAKAKNIPVIATAVGVNPAGKELFSAVYAADDYALGKALADYLLKKNPKTVAVGQTATVVYAADQLVVAAKDTLQKNGATMAAVADVDVTNLVNSFSQTATDLVLAHPNATALVSCCDFAPLMDLPALKTANRTDVTLLTRYDNATSLQAIRSGVALAVAANNTDIFNLAALDVLAAYFSKGQPIPATLPDMKSEIKIVDKDNVPAQGFVYPFEPELASYTARWSNLYQY
jgi:ABC-type sugar transport system substrate-binding protein